MNEQVQQKKNATWLQKAGVAVALTAGTCASVFAADSSLPMDISAIAGLGAIALIGSSASTKAVPTFAAWAMKKALSMLR